MCRTLLLVTVVVMTGCIQPQPIPPEPQPTPPAPTPDPVPPTPDPTPTDVSIEGVGEVDTGQYANLTVRGLTLGQLGKGKVVWWPRDVLEVLPVQTWTGEPLLLVKSNRPGDYILQVMAVDKENLCYAEHVLTIKGDDPEPEPEPGPTPPDPDPDPDPDPIPPEPIPVPDDLSFIFIEETESRTGAEAAAVLSPAIASRLAAKGWQRILLDKDVKNKEGKTPESVKPYIERGVAKGLPYLIIINTEDGAIYREGPLPAEQELLELLDKLGA